MLSLLRRTLLVLTAFFALTPAAWAIIDSTLQMQMGNPSNSTATTTNHLDYLISRAQYTLAYNDTTREPNWVAWDLTSGDVGSSGRSPNFIQDTTLPAGFYQVLPTDYSGSGYDRGHMCPSADRTVTAADNLQVFYMSNMIPQAPDNNQGVWASFETACRNFAAAGNEILIISGPSGFVGTNTIASGVAIPGYTWKIAVVVPLGSGTALSRITPTTRVIAIKIPNVAGVRNNPWQQYVTSAAAIEADTGYNFFRALPTNTANALRAQVDGQTSTGIPTITTQPVAQTSTVSGTASFTVAATATTDTNFTYQWLKDDAEIVGATAATLTLTNVQAANLGTYVVVVTNSAGSVTSSGAALVINGLPPVITASPAAKSAAAGTTVTFLGAATGSPTLTYQWRKDTVALVNGTGIAGATTATLTLTNVQAASAGSYDLVVTNSVNSATTAAAALTVTAAAPTITTPPAAATAAAASTTSFTVVASGTAPFTYQWRKGGVNLTDGAVSGAATISGSTTATLTLTTIALADAGSYDVVVTNSVSSTTSAAATLTIATVGAGFQTSYAGGTYTQDFNTLPSTGTFTFTGAGPFALSLAAPNGVGATGLAGWSVAKISGTGANEVFLVGTGSANSGSVYSFGAASAADRALGTVLSGTVGSVFGLVLTNTTGATITQFTVSYTGEQYRYGGGTVGGTDKLSFEYQVGGTSITTGTFTAATSLDFTSRINSSAAASAAATLDGNATANRAAVTATITGITWASGQTLVLRWKDFDVAGSDDGLAIDDFSFTTPVGSAPVTPAVLSTTPAASAIGVNGASPIGITFNQPVNVTGSWFTLTSALNGIVAATVTGGPTTYTLTPPINFIDNDTVTVTVAAAQITDSATGLVHPAADATFSFTTAAPVAPTIATAPVAVTTNAGTSATFTVAAAGTAPFSYQWRKATVAITGATTATLTLTNVQAADAASYDVVVTNSVSSVTSTPVALTVTPVAPALTTAPVAATVTAGGTATFVVAATGTTPFTYQWRLGGVNLTNGATTAGTTVAGATTSTLSLTTIALADAGNIDVVVTNTVASTPSTPVALTVNPVPVGPTTNYAGGTYTQNFDTLPNAGTFTFTGNGPFALDAAAPNGVGAAGLAGWSLVKYAGTGANAIFRFDNGTSNSGGINSYGAASATERALGSLASGSTVSRLGVAFVNTTGATITQFTLGYTGEQWRYGGSSVANKLTFAYAVGGTDLNTGTFTAATALDFTAPVNTATAGTLGAVAGLLDGNAAANRTVVAPVTITGLSWAPGQTLVLRWTDVDDTGSDDGLAIDDLTFTASTPPTPATVTLGALAVTYDGTAKAATVTTTPANLAVSLTYAGVATVPTDAGSYAVVATITNPNYVGSATGTLVIAKAAQTIAFTAPANQLSTAAPFALTASASSGLGVTFSIVSGPATVSGGTLTVTGAGSVTVRASQAGNNNYTAAADVDRSFTVTAPAAPPVTTPTAATVTFGALAATYDGTAKAATVTTAPAGLAVSLTYDGSATAPTAPGSYAVVATVTASGYSGNATGTLVIAKADQVIAFAALADRLTTAATSTLNATASSGLGVTFALVSGPATVSGSVLSLTGTAGSVTVRASQAGNALYNAAAPVDRTFTVTAATAGAKITGQPAPQSALVGATVSFTVVATGTPAPTYQWRKNGTAIAGNASATTTTLTLTNVQTTDAASYDVVVTNPTGGATSSLAALTVTATATAPVITRQPANLVAVVGGTAAFSVGATGAPAPTYQWSKNGVAIAGATGPAITLTGVTSGDAGGYTVVVTNSAGTATSRSALLGVIGRSYAGSYFGTLGNGGTFALFIRADNTGIFLGFAPGVGTAYLSRGVSIDENGNFTFATTVTSNTAAAGDQLATTTDGAPTAAAELLFTGSIGADGNLSGSAGGVTLAATKAATDGATQSVAGYYEAGAAGSSAQTLTIISPAGQVFVLAQTASGVDGGTGTVTAAGQVTVTTAAGQTINGTVASDTSAVTTTLTDKKGATTVFSGTAENSSGAADQRLVNLSSRVRTASGDQAAIAGFVISGEESKTVLIRAVGPTLTSFGVTGVLGAPKLDLYRGSTVISTNTAWGNATNASEIAAAAARAGAFALAPSSADSVVLTTLAPGAYTAIVSAASGSAGVALIEVYDLSGAATGQKLINLSTRATAGTGSDTLIAGVVVSGSAPKRMLIRAAGPTLAQFGLSGVLARPQLTLYSGSTVVVQNAGWSTSADASAILDATNRVGAFAFATGSLDAALIVNLPPGAYTAQVTGVNGTTGVALVEVYELP